MTDLRHEFKRIAIYEKLLATNFDARLHQCIIDMKQHVRKVNKSLLQRADRDTWTYYPESDYETCYKYYTLYLDESYTREEVQSLLWASFASYTNADYDCSGRIFTFDFKFAALPQTLEQAEQNIRAWRVREGLSLDV